MYKWCELDKWILQTYPWKPTWIKIEKSESEDNVCHLK